MANETLSKDLKLRQVMMIAIGGTIGTGLFVGISMPLQVAGNLGTPLAYLLAGVVMLLTMMCLGELSSAMPHSGSFQHYMSVLIPNQYWSYIIGWLYWLSWILTIAADLTATAMTLHDFFSSIPVSIFVLGIIIFLGCVHLYSANIYGESETIFTVIKLTTIMAFLLCAVLLLVKSDLPAVVTQLSDTSVSLPLGFIGVLTCMTTVTYAYQGVEMVATVVGESKEAAKSMPYIIKMLVVRVLLFYILSTTLLAFIYPIGYIADISPFVWVFTQTNIPYADTIMKVVIILCGLSASSAAVYASSRLLWSMSKDNIAPPLFKIVSKKGAPVRAVICTLGMSSVALVTQWYAPEKVYLYLISSTGQVGCAAWLCICICLIKFRHARQNGQFSEFTPQYKAPFFPALPILAIILNAMFIIGLWFGDNGLSILIGELILITFFSVCYIIKNNKQVIARVLT